VALALAAAIGWGLADFFGGRTSREVAALVVLAASQGVGFAIAVLAAIVGGLEAPEASDLAFAALSGLTLTLGLATLYRAMAVGAMSVAAPIAGTGAVIPVAVGLAGGDDPSALQLLGIAAALAGVALCSYSQSGDSGRSAGLATGVGLALLAAIGGGLTATALAAASSAGVLWVLLIQRGTVFAIASTLVVGRERSPTLPGDLLPIVFAMGVLDLAATGLFTAATVNGELSLVAVVGALYPVVTVMLAMTLLSERLAVHQAIGVVAAFGGVAAIAGG
jgi:drug/metabolite transporter (DMT)-like permease